MVGTLWGLLVPSMLVYKIWWPNRDKQLWEGRGEHEKGKNSVWLKWPNYFCLRLSVTSKSYFATITEQGLADMGYVGQKILLRRVISRLQLNSENPTASKTVASEVSLLPGLDLQQELCSIEHSPTLRRPRTLMCPKPCSFTFWHLRFELCFTG